MKPNRVTDRRFAPNLPTSIKAARSSIARVVAGVDATADMDEQSSDVAEPSTPVARYATQDEVRARIASWLRQLAPELEGVAEDLALGVHPWPDSPLGTDEARELLSEMHARRNVHHPDLREVIADRLLRIAEALLYYGADGVLVDRYEAAAGRLVRAAVETSQHDAGVVSQALVDPLSTRLITEEVAAPAAVALPRSSLRAAQVVPLLVEAACRQGSVDIATVLGLGSGSLSLAQLVGATDFLEGLARFDQWITDLEPRSRELIDGRIYPRGSDLKLQELGDAWGVTRERVRQREAKLRESIERVFGRDLKSASLVLAPMERFVLPQQLFDVVLGEVFGGLNNPWIVASAVLGKCGPWKRSAEWVHHGSLVERLKEARDATLGAADIYGLLPVDATAEFTGLFASDGDEAGYLRTGMGLTEMNGLLAVRDSQRARIAAALRHIGGPATRLEIARAAGLDEEARINLSMIPGLVRADKERWAFADLVDDPYDGIAGEIRQRINAGHGSVAVAVLVDEIPRLFGVSEGSVHAYLQTPAFVIDAGFVSEAEAGVYESAHPSKWRDAEKHGDVWGQRLQVEQRYLEGYSMKVRFDIAFANGLRPSCDLRVPIEGFESLASVIWRPHDITRGVDVGRVAGALSALGYTPGDSVLVIPEPNRVRLLRPGVAAPPDSLPEIAHSDPLLDLLGGGDD